MQFLHTFTIFTHTLNLILIHIHYSSLQTYSLPEDKQILKWTSSAPMEAIQSLIVEEPNKNQVCQNCCRTVSKDIV